MAISFVASSTTTAHVGTTTVTPTLPAGTAIGDRVYISVSSAPAATATNTPTGWTKVVDQSLGPGTYAAVAGPRRCTVMYRDRDTAWAMPAVTVASGSSIAAVAYTVRKDAADTWDAPVAVWGPKPNTTATTAFTATSTGSMTVKAGGLMLVTTVLPDPGRSSNPQASATGGITQLSPTEFADGGQTTGNDAHIICGRATVGDGGTGTFTRSSTLSVATDSGGTAFVHQSVTEPAPVEPITLPYAQDFTGTNGTLPANWSNISTGASGIQSNALQVVQSGAAWSGVMAQLAPMPQDYDLRFTWTFTASTDQYPAVNLRVPSSTTPLAWSSRMNDGYYFQTYPVAGSESLEYGHMVAGVKTGYTGMGVPTTGVDTPYRVRVLVEGTRVAYKTWPAADAEPADWLVDTTTNATGDRLVFGTTAAPVGAQIVIDDVSIAAPGPAGQQLTATLTDAAAIVDSISTAMTRTRDLVDAAAATDSIATVLARDRVLTDSAALTDSASTAAARVRDLTDAAAITDSASWTLAAARDLTSSAAITDSATTALDASRALADSAALTDSATTAVTRVRDLVDAAGITDSATWALTQVVDRQLADAAAITDSLTWVIDRARELSDSAAITDAATTALQAVRALSDSAAITDSISTTLAASRALADDAAITDSASTQLAAARQLTDSAAITDSATWSLTGAQRYIDWMGHNWWVRGSTVPEPPTQSNPNYWGNTDQTVEILPDGKLKLSISQVNGQWRSAEVDQNDSNILGYGRYRWTYDIDAINLDRQPVLGLYIYELVSDVPGKREIDIEVTRWGVPEWQHRFWYSVHPTNTNNEVPAQGQPIVHRQGSHMVSSAGPYTSEFVWQPGQVYFRTTAADGSVVGEHVVTEGVQAPRNQRLSMNFWLNSGTGGPSNGQPVTATIHSFEYTAGATHDLVPAAQFVEDFADVQGWTTLNGAEIAGGDLTIPAASILPAYNATGYSGHVLDMRASSTQIELGSVPIGAQEVFWHTLWDAGNAFTMYVSEGVLHGRRLQGGTPGFTPTVAFSPTAHRWWRITQAAGTVSFHTSPDGETWNLLGSLAHTLSTAQLSAMRQQFDAGGWEATATPFTVSRVGAVPAVAHDRTLTDAAGISDSASWTIHRRVELVDNAGITDSATRVVDARRELSDSAAITDQGSAALATAGGRTLVDYAAITDSATTRLDAVRALSDSAAITDTATTALSTPRALSDSAAITDSATWTIERHVTLVDNAGITDSASTAADVRRTLQDSASITDSVTVETTVAAEEEARELADAAGITDSATWTIDRHRTLVDSIATSDTITTDLKVGSAQLISSAAITDSATWTIDRHRTLVDSVAITDRVTTARQIFITLVDSAGITDSVTSRVTVGRNVTVQWGAPTARSTTARAVGYRRMTGTRVLRVGQISRGSYGGT